MFESKAVTVLWWTIPVRLMFWFSTAFASTIGFIEFSETFLFAEFQFERVEELSLGFFSSVLAVVFLTNERILNAQKTQKQIKELKGELNNISSFMTEDQKNRLASIETASERLSQYGVSVDPYSEFDLGWMALEAGRFDSAERYYSQALAEFQSRNDTEGCAEVMAAIGEVLRMKGNLEQAEKIIRKSIELYASMEQGNPNMGYSFNVLGLIFQTYGDLDEAERLFMESKSLFEDNGDLSFGFLSSLNNLGINSQIKGDLDAASEFYVEALSYAERFDDVVAQVFVLNNLGEIERERGNYIAAKKFYMESLTTATIEKLEQRKLTPMNNIGLLYMNTGELSKAQKYFDECLAGSQKSGQREIEGLAFFNLGELNRLKSGFSSAEEYYLKGLEIFTEIGDRGKQALGLNNLGLCEQAKGNNEQAIEYYSRSLELLRQTETNLSISLPLHNMGLLYEETSDFVNAHSHLQESLEQRRKFALSDEYNTIFSLGRVSYNLGEIDEARNWLNQAIEIGINNGNLVEIGNGEFTLGELELESENMVDAKKHFASAEEYFRRADEELLLADCLVQLAIISEIAEDFDEQKKYNIEAVSIWRKHEQEVPEWYLNQGY